MDYIQIVICKIGVLFILIMVGVGLSGIKMIHTSTNKELTSLLLYVVNPMLVFNSFQMEKGAETAAGFLRSFGLALLCMGIQILLALLLIHGKDKRRVAVERLAAAFPSCGFLGLPIVNALYGSAGLIHISIFNAAMNVAFWTVGVLIMTGKHSWKETLKNLMTPTLIAVLAGIIFFLTDIHLPAILSEPITLLGNMNTPLSMIITGIMLRESHLSVCISDLRSWYITALSLLVAPAVVGGVVLLFRLPYTLGMVQIIASACPMMTTAAVMAYKEEVAAEHAAHLYALTTVVCMATIPLIITVFSALYSIL